MWLFRFYRKILAHCIRAPALTSSAFRLFTLRLVHHKIGYTCVVTITFAVLHRARYYYERALTYTSNSDKEKLCYRRRTARRAVSVEIWLTAAQLFLWGLRALNTPLPEKNLQFPSNSCQIVCSKFVFDRDNELQIGLYHGNFLLIDNKHRKL